MENKLNQSVSAIDGTFIIFGTVIGTGIFASPGVVLGTLHESVGLSLTVWIAAGILCILGGLCYAELGASIPKAGGEYIYLVKGLHPFFGFLYVWASFICLRTGSLTIISIVFARYFGSVIFSLDTDDPEIDKDLRIKLLAMGAITFLSLLNLLDVKWGTRIQNCLSIFKFIAIGLVIILAIIGLATGETLHIAKENFTDMFVLDDDWEITAILTSIGTATIAALWAYDGFSNLNLIAEEVKQPERSIPIATTISLSAVSFFYVIINISYLCVLTTSEVVTSKAVAVDQAQVIAGKPGEIIMPLLVAISAFGALNGTILVNARVFFAAARDNLFPFSNYVSRLNRFNVPYVAIIIQTIVAVLLVIPGEFESLINYFGFTAWIFYALVVCCLIILRFTEPDANRPFKVRPFPWVPIIFILAASLIIISAFIQDTIPSIITVAVILIGAPIYFLFFWRGNCFYILLRKLCNCTSEDQPILSPSEGEMNDEKNLFYETDESFDSVSSTSSKRANW